MPNQFLHRILGMDKIQANGLQDRLIEVLDANFAIIDARLADIAGFGEISTYPTPGASFSTGTPTANRGYWARAYGAGPITKLGYFTSVSSGNADVGVYAGGQNYAAPGARRGSSGSTAMPVAGYSEHSLTAATTVVAGDYFAWVCDNGVARFSLVSTGGQGADVAFTGRYYLGDGKFPLPDPAGGLPASQGHGAAMRGVA